MNSLIATVMVILASILSTVVERPDPANDTRSIHTYYHVTINKPTTKISTVAPVTNQGEVYYGSATHFNGNWDYMIRYYKRQTVDICPDWEVLPKSWEGYGYYGAMPEEWGLHGKTVDVTYRGKTVRVQLLDVVRRGQDSIGFRRDGKVIDLSPQVFSQFQPLSEGMLFKVQVRVEN